MIFVTGDTHRDFSRFSLENFPEQKEMTRDDYVIICGDFGGVWYNDEQDEEVLDDLAALPFTILFVSGNHENFAALESYYTTLWHGGKVQLLRENVIHLMRGQVYTIDKKKFFTMGGAASHDIGDGILDVDDPDFEEKLRALICRRAQFRINEYSWWKEEMPSDQEYEEALKNLEENDWTVDYVLTHCGPNSIVDIIGHGYYEHDRLTDFLEEIMGKIKFNRWFFGHYHDDRMIGKHTVLYEEIVPLTLEWFGQELD